jgi:hypothetical protein
LKQQTTECPRNKCSNFDDENSSYKCVSGNALARNWKHLKMVPATASARNSVTKRTYSSILLKEIGMRNERCKWLLTFIFTFPFQ